MTLTEAEQQRIAEIQRRRHSTCSQTAWMRTLGGQWRFDSSDDIVRDLLAIIRRLTQQEA